MKEELKNYLNKHAQEEMWLGTTTAIWMEIIDKFFDQNQPERSKREDVEKYDGPTHLPDKGWPSKNIFP